MDFINYILVFYLVIINLFAVFVTIFDKHRAFRHKHRVKESTLLTLSLLGGSVSMYITMQLIRHKTKHLKFMLGIPLIIILQIFLIITVYIYAR